MKTKTFKQTKSVPLSAKGSATLGECEVPEETSSNVRGAHASTHDKGGTPSASSSAGKKQLAAKKLSALKPLSHKQRQLILGSNLGDGCMDFSLRHSRSWKPMAGRFCMNHGAVQEKYCRAKSHLLSNYINTDARIVPNRGYGEESCVFSTLLTPVLSFMLELAYISDPSRPGKYLKHVSQAWVDELTWEAVAWWFMDDGCRNAQAFNIATHSFSLKEVERLCGWLTKNGCPAHPHKTRKRDKYYWTLQIPTASAKFFKSKILPFMHPSMLYKLDIEETQECVCNYCGDSFMREGESSKASKKNPCCLKRSCRGEKRKENRAKSIENCGGMKALYQRTKKRIAKYPQKKRQLQDRSNVQQAERFSDPEYRAKWGEWKKEYRKRLKAEGRPEKQGMELVCQHCARPFRNTGTHKICKDAQHVYCTAPPCLEKHRVKMTRIRLDRAAEKRRLERLSKV